MRNWYTTIIADNLKQQTDNLIDDDWFSDIKPRKETTTDSPKAEAATLTLYRGFNADLNKLQRSGNSYVLSPAKSEQGVMWFTHKLINGYDPVEYVTGRGRYLLTYPLQCVKHSQIVHYEDGTTYEKTPEEIVNKTNGLENCPFYRGYELPTGWFFSYKNEKFIICTIPLLVTPTMIQHNSQPVEANSQAI